MLRVREFVYVGICLFISLGVVIVISVIQEQRKPEKNGFSRNLQMELRTPISAFNLGYNSFYFAGNDAKNIYLGNSTAPTLLLKVNYSLRDTTYSWLSTPESLRISKTARVYADSANVYLMDGITPNFLYSSLSTLQLALTETDGVYFSTAIPLSKKSYVARAFDGQKQQYVLTKKRAQIPYDSQANPILEKQQDGRFSVDGILSYNSKAGILTYVYYYRNEFITMDTSLNILYKGHTIDTISLAQIKTAKLNTRTGEKYVLAAPANEVNKHSCLSTDRIFIHSARKADNEDRSTFQNSTVIDIYLLKDGKYEFSFYLENYKDNRLNSMMVYNDTLIALFGNYICSYKLEFDSVKH